MVVVVVELIEVYELYGLNGVVEVVYSLIETSDTKSRFDKTFPGVDPSQIESIVEILSLIHI